MKALADDVQPITIYGYLSHDDRWTQDNSNIYSFNAVDEPEFMRVPDELSTPVTADGGGCYHDGRYYAVEYAGFMGLVLADFCVYDTETWEMLEYIPTTAGAVSVDMDYDVTTGFIYGCFYSDEWDHCVFGYIDPQTGMRTKISDLNRIYFGIAVNSKGEVYGISEEGNLVRFNKQNGELTLIGNTGYTPEYLAGATFDLQTDQLYWTICSSDKTVTGLYLVDTATAATTCVSHFAHNEEVQGLFIPIPAALPLAPAVATDLRLAFEGAALEGSVSFRAPFLTYDESDDLYGELTYYVYADGEQVATGTTKPGIMTDAPFAVPTEGAHAITVRTANGVGLSPAAHCSQWFGYDYPTAVTNLKAVEGEENGKVVVSWVAPTTTQHNGYLASESMSYKVVRMPDGVMQTTSATTLTDVVPLDRELTAYQYVVTPVVLDRYEGESAASNTVALGKALQLPYMQDFADATSFDLFTVVDRHEDGKTWAYDATFEAARAEYDWVNPKNDWLITPAMQMDAEHVYTLAFDAFSRDNNPENLEVKMGKSHHYENMTKQILPRTTELNGMEPKHFFEIIALDEAGDWNIGFHAVSPVDRWWLYVDNICVEQGPLKGTPHRVTNFRAVAGERGALSALLTFTAPAELVDGGALDAITRIDIYRDGVLIESIDHPEPGTPLRYKDVNARQGQNVYRVVAVNGVGEGLKAETSVYVGVDIPVAPSNVLLQKVDELPVLTWEAPTQGVNGLYVNPDEVVYYIVRSDNVQVGTQVRGTSFTDTTLPLKGDEQSFYLYAIYAQNVAGLDDNQFAISNEVCFGRPYELTFHESFAGVKLQQGPWTWDIAEGDDPYLQIVAVGQYPACEPQDGDGGLVSFMPEDRGDAVILTSANLSLKEAETPRISFWYYNNPGAGDLIEVSVRVDDNPAEEHQVALVTMDAANTAEGWSEAQADLSAYAGHLIQLRFRFESKSGEYVHVDNITVTDRFDHRLPAVSDLTANVTDGGVLLTWTEPDTESFSQVLGLIGFNIYRDGSLLNAEEPEVETSYLDENARGAAHSYRVSTVYDLGESYLSNEVTVGADGIRAIAADQAEAHGIRYNVMGQRVLSKEPKGMLIIEK